MSKELTGPAKVMTALISAAEANEREQVKYLARVIKQGGWISLAEAARDFGISASTLLTSAKKGNLPAVQVASGCWLVRRAAVALGVGLHGRRGRPRRIVKVAVTA